MPIKMQRYSDHNKVVRFMTKDKDSPVRDVYVSRTLPGINEAQEITFHVAVEKAAAPATPAPEPAAVPI